MATIIVDTTFDENDGGIVDGDVSLRDALALANSGDTITFASGAGEAFDGGGTIRLAQALGELVIASDVTIDGDLDDDGAPDVTLTGDALGDDVTTTDPLGNTVTDALANNNTADNVRVLNVTGGSSIIDGLVITGGSDYGAIGVGILVADGAALTISGSSVSGNNAGYGAGIYNKGTTALSDAMVFGNTAYRGGGGIHNAGTLTLTNTTVSSNDNPNYFFGSGGGIFNSGIATLNTTTVSDNHSHGGGGGIANTGTVSLTDTIVSDNGGVYGAGGIDNTGTLTVTNATISENGSSYGGGGIRNTGTAEIIDTTISGNRSGYFGGAGIGNSGGLTLTNVTVSGNRVVVYGDGGGLRNTGTAALTNTTVSGNSAGEYDGSGGGIHNNATASLILANTIVLGNRAFVDTPSSVRIPIDSDIEGTFAATGPNLVGGNAGDVFAAIDGATGGGLLADNGGPVQTIALRNDASNPALDAGQDGRLDETVVGIDLNGDGDANDVIDTDARGTGFDRRADLPGVANNGANIADLGAFELANTTPSLITGTGNADTITPGFVSAGVTGGQPLAGDDTINALGGNDTVDGGGGADSMDGGAGNDSLLGGDGDDTLRGNWGFDTLDGGDGNDTADLSHSASGATIDLDAGEVAIGGGTETLISIENAIGTNGDNFITGTGGANRLAGAGGDDTLKGGWGFDTLDGGAGSDTADLSHSGSAATIDLEAGEAVFGVGVETLISIENVIGTNGDNFITGTGGVNRLEGGGGDDTLRGSWGLDTLDGGDGNDTADLSHTSDNISIDLEAGEAVFGIGVEILTSIENVVGTNGDNFITGTGGANKLEGAGGDDTLKGGWGFDTLDGGAGSDTADLSHSGSAATIDLAAGQAVFGGGVEVLISIENAIGTNGNNTMIGTAGANTLEGGGGDDTLQGNGGPDRFAFGGTAFDRDTIIDFALGTDKIVLDGVGGANDADDLTYTVGNFGGGGAQDIRVTFGGLGASLVEENIDVLDVGSDVDALKADILFV